jgi:hypothetical protein
MIKGVAICTHHISTAKLDHVGGFFLAHGGGKKPGAGSTAKSNVLFGL